jgi:hypothetical protein
MSGIKEHIDAWYKYVKADVKAIEEDPEILAGREAEDLLRNIVNEHYQFKGCHSFSSKRVYNPSAGHKNEIDLIIVTEKKLYILECKNWGGQLKREDGKWIQYKRQRDGSYRTISHDDVVAKNEEKRKVLIDFLRSNGIDISDSDCTQKVILMNRKLAIHSEDIYNDPKVIPPDRLDHYLGRQETRLKPHERFFASVISLLLDDETSSKIVDGLFKRLGGKDYKRLINSISGLPTWDKVILHGTKIISGDVRKSDRSIFKSAYGIPFDQVKTIKNGIIRSKGIFLVKSVLTIGRPIALDLYDMRGSYIKGVEGHPDGIIRIQPAGSPDCIDIPIFQIEEIVYGKYN